MRRKLVAFIMCLSIILSGLQVGSIDVQAAQFTGTHFGMDLDAHDSGTMEMSSWSNGGMFNCTWSPNNISFADGIMSLKIDSNGNGGYTGGEYRTQQTFGYGMYSVSMKPISNPGVVTSFFTYTGPTDGTVWDEIDIEFLGYDTTKVQFNYFTNGVGEHEHLYDLGFDASKEFHTYGFFWAQDSITWYVDGNPVYTATVDIPSTPGKIMMNVWPGIGVDDWLKPYNGVTPIYGYYDWAAYDAPSMDSDDAGNGNNNSNGDNIGNDTTQQPELSNSKVYKIISKNSGKALDVYYGLQDNGTNILQYNYAGTTNQKWFVQKQSNGYYIVKNYATGKVLAVENSSNANGANVYQWEYTGSTNQEWNLVYANGYYKIVNRNSGLLLNVADVSTADNANVEQWQDVSMDNQLWSITELEEVCNHASTEIRDSKGASCKESGYTGDTYCTICGEKRGTGTTIDKLTTHNWDEGRITQEPSVSADGVKTYTCTVCGETRTEIVPFVCNHADTELRYAKEATCKESGYTGDTYCRICGERQGTGTAIGKLTTHSWDEGTITTPATETENGVKTYTCTICRETRTEVIFATGKNDDPDEEDNTTEKTTAEDVTTEEPTTEKSTTEEMTTEEKTTEESTTEELTTEEPTTEDVTTEEPTTEGSTTEEPTTEGSTTEEKTTEESTTEEPITEGSTTEEKTTEESTTEEPTMEGSTTEEPTTEGSTTEEPITEESTTEEPTTEEPTTEESTTEEPTTEGSTTEESTTENITTEENQKQEEGASTEQNTTTEDKKEEGTVVTPAKGTILEDSVTRAQYKVITSDSNSKTVEYVSPADATDKTITIPATVTINGIEYRVTGIAKNAFANNKKITKVVIGSNVISIGVNAFKGCTNLKEVVIGKNVTKIGKKAFYGCKKLKRITIKTSKLSSKNVGSKAFAKTYMKAVVKVPKKKIKTYKMLLVKKGINKKATIKK